VSTCQPVVNQVVVVLIFTDKQYLFLKNEFGLTRKSIDKMDTAALEELYEEICNVEIDEAWKIRNGGALSNRGKMAVELVDYMAEALGYIPDNIEEELEEE